MKTKLLDWEMGAKHPLGLTTKYCHCERKYVIMDEDFECPNPLSLFFDKPFKKDEIFKIK